MSVGSRKKTRILHVTFNMDIGGTEQVISQLVTNINSKSFDSRILCIDGRVGPMGEMLRIQGHEVSGIPRQSGLDLSLVRRIKSVINDENIDIVHCHQYTPFIYGWFAHWGTSAKLVFTEHGRFHPDRYRFKAIGINPIMAMTTRKVVAISNATKKALQKYEFFPPYTVGVIYNGIRPLQSDEASRKALAIELGLKSGQPVIGTVARLDAVKNQAMMIRSFKTVLEVIPNCKLLLIGDGPERDRLEVLASSLGIRERVIFTGFVQQPCHHMALLDVFLLPSFTEGTSMTLLEAMSLGIPCVVTSVGGNPEIVVHEETGLLCESEDQDGLSSAITLLLHNTDLRSEFSENAKRRFESRFMVGRMIDSYTGLYGELVDGHRV